MLYKIIFSSRKLGFKLETSLFLYKEGSLGQDKSNGKESTVNRALGGSTYPG